MSTAAGFVVAGGHSRRMGRDKALLSWGATTLLDHALARLRVVCSDVRILSGASSRYADRDVPVLLDAWPDGGPLGGVLAGLESLDDDERPGLFLAVDVPYVPAALLAHLLSAAPGWEAVVPVSARGPEPLCALYRAACRGPIRHCLSAGERRIDSFWPAVRVRWIDVDELRPFGDPATLFANVNTLEDYVRLKER